MNLVFEKSVLSGKLYAPSSKSLSHRLLITSFLSNDKSSIRSLSDCDDIKATLDSLLKVGGTYSEKDGVSYISPIEKAPDCKIYVDCKDSASTLRFLMPVFLSIGGDYVFGVSESLSKRPMDEYERIFKEKGITFEKDDSSYHVSGKIDPGIYEVSSRISSQFASGLIMALSFLPGKSVICFKDEINSRPYIEMTVSIMKECGVTIEFENDRIVINGKGRYGFSNKTVESDPSACAVLSSFSYVFKEEIKVVFERSGISGDWKYEEYFERIKNGFCEIDISDNPDLTPILLSLSSFYNGVKLVSSSRLRYKESDRPCAMKDELSKFGVNVDVFDDYIEIKDPILKKPSEKILSHNDHRIAMAMTLPLLKFGGTMENCECVSKSFPAFFDELSKIGARITKEE